MITGFFSVNQGGLFLKIIRKSVIFWQILEMKNPRGDGEQRLKFPLRSISQTETNRHKLLIEKSLSH